MSGVYFENRVISENYGTTAAYFADPAIIGHETHGPEDGDLNGVESFLAQTFAGQIRGERQTKMVIWLQRFRFSEKSILPRGAEDVRP